jgi:magnesium transporter
MIRFWKKEGTCLVQVQNCDSDTWVDVRNASREDLDILEKEYNVLPEHLQDMLDADEGSRIEKEDDYTMMIVRLPVFDAFAEVVYYTVPVGLILFDELIITVCAIDCEALEEMTSNKVKDLQISNTGAFVLKLMGRGAIIYLRYLKDLNRRTAIIEHELQRSIRNNELVQLLAIQKSLVFFTTSLRSDELVLEKLQKSRTIRFKEEESELLEDVSTDFKQAIQMSNIYSDILTGMMDAFASVISNNLNIIMKRLTIVTIVLMIATFVVSIFGMNIPNPWMETPEAFIGILVTAGLAAILGAFILKDKRKPLPLKRTSSYPASTEPVSTP